MDSLFCDYFRNDSGKVAADMEIIFGQYVEMKLFITLYQALYRNGSFGDLPVQPIWDNGRLSLFNSTQERKRNQVIFQHQHFVFFIYLVPGKPPENISVHATGTTSILMEWTTVPVKSEITLFRVFYVKTSKQNETIARTDVNVTKRSVKIEKLEKFVNYTVWIKSVSARGFGVSSIPIYVRTLEEGESCIFKSSYAHFLLGACFLIIVVTKISLSCRYKETFQVESIPYTECI